MLNPKLDEVKEDIFWNGNSIPFYWNDSYLVDISDVAVWEYNKKIIPNTFTNYSWEKQLQLFDTSPFAIFNFLGDNISYHIKIIQYLNYFFSDLILYDKKGNILIKLDDLYEYYEGVNDPEIATNLWSWSASEYIITITQEMIDSCRKKYEK
jgi:hypothetical protein